jgi:hypothetical protein
MDGDKTGVVGSGKPPAKGGLRCPKCEEMIQHPVVTTTWILADGMTINNNCPWCGVRL